MRKKTHHAVREGEESKLEVLSEPDDKKPTNKGKSNFELV